MLKGGTWCQWLVVAAICGSLATIKSHAAEIGEPVKLEKIEAAKGRALTGKRLQRKVTVINLWATWCEACKIELAEMADQFKSVRKHKNLQIAFVSLDKDPDAARAYFAEKFKDTPWMMEHLYFDPQFSLAESLHAQSFPMTVIVTPRGKVGYVQAGFEAGKGHTEALVTEVKSYLK